MTVSYHDNKDIKVYVRGLIRITHDLAKTKYNNIDNCKESLKIELQQFIDKMGRDSGDNKINPVY